MQPGVGKVSETYLLASKQAPIVGYPQLLPPNKTVEIFFNAVQGISHGLATLHRSQGFI